MISRRLFLKTAGTFLATTTFSSSGYLPANRQIESTSPVALTTGFSKLDEFLGGRSGQAGFMRGSMNCIGGAAGAGKTQLISELAIRLASEGFFVTFHSPEFSAKQIAYRYFSPILGGRIQAKEIASGTKSYGKWMLCDQNGNRVLSNIAINDKPCPSLSEIQAELEALSKTGNDAVCIIDYIALFADVIDSYRVGRRADLARLREVAQATNSTIILVEHMNRNFGCNRMPINQDGKDYELLTREQYFQKYARHVNVDEMDTAIMLFRACRWSPLEYLWPHSDMAKLVVAKNNFGFTGEMILGFDEETHRFYA